MIGSDDTDGTRSRAGAGAVIGSANAVLLAQIGISGTHNGGVASVALTSAGQLLVTGNVDSSIDVWQPAIARLVHRLQGHRGAVLSLALSSDGVTLASGSADTTARLWTLSDGKSRHALPTGTSVNAVAFTADGATLVAAVDDQQVFVWRASDGTKLRTIDVSAGSAYGVAVSPDPAYPLVAVGSFDGTVRVFGVDDGAPISVLRGHTAAVYGVAYSSAGDLIASASMDATVRLWSTADDTSVATLHGHTEAVRSVAFSEGVLASSSDDGTVRVWDVATASTLCALKSPSMPTQVAFSPDLTALATGAGAPGPAENAQALVWGAP